MGRAVGIPVQKQNGQEQRVGSSACPAQTRRLRETTHTHTHTHTHVQNTWGREMDKQEKPAHLHWICRIRIPNRQRETAMQAPRDRPRRCRKTEDT